MSRKVIAFTVYSLILYDFRFAACVIRLTGLIILMAMNCGNKKTFWSWGDVYPYILMPVDLLHTFVVHSGTTRVFIYLHVCVSTPIFTIAHIRMLIWLSCYYCYYTIIMYVIYTLYNVLLCKSGNGKPSCACVRFVFTPRLLHPGKSPRVTFQTWHYWVVSQVPTSYIIVISLVPVSSFMISLYNKTFFKHPHHNDRIIRFSRNYSFVPTFIIITLQYTTLVRLKLMCIWNNPALFGKQKITHTN